MITRAPAWLMAGPLARSVSVAVLLCLVTVVPVLAHAELVSSDPEDRAVLAAAPTSVTLTFSEGLDAGKSSFRLIGPDGPMAVAKATEDGAKVIRLDSLRLAAGAYTVRWTAAAQDGHIERGTLTFTVSEPTPAPATRVPATTSPTLIEPTPADPATAEPTVDVAPAGAIEPSPAPSPEASPVGTSTGDVLLPIAAGLLVVGIVGALVLRRSRRV